MLEELPPNLQLATAYASISGHSDEFVNLWAREGGVRDLSFAAGAAESSEMEDLYRLVEYETIDYNDPLPYSRLR